MDMKFMQLLLKQITYISSYYTNFQPLWMLDNCSKGNRYVG